jgi:predicted Zn-dependent protease
MLFLLPACTTVQETGRRQLNLIPDDQAASMGAQAFRELRAKEKVSTDAAVNARIEGIGRRIAAAVGRDLPDAQWEFVVFESEQVNAFALPGGKVGVYTGLIKLAGSDDEIAAVMGHEVAHVTSRHGAERQSQALMIALGGAAVGISTRDQKNQELYLLAYGLTTSLGALAYSRDHETEADVVGLRFAARAGFDPRAAASFWRKMQAKETGGRPPKFLSTHPSSEDRIKNLERLAPALMPLYEQARAGRGEAVSGATPASPVAMPAGGGEQEELDRFLRR